jgi:serine/threonine protein kinase
MSSTQDESVKAEEKEKEEKENNRVGTPFYLAPELWKN